MARLGETTMGTTSTDEAAMLKRRFILDEIFYWSFERALTTSNIDAALFVSFKSIIHDTIKKLESAFTFCSRRRRCAEEHP
jgi:hypothetical protein